MSSLSETLCAAGTARVRAWADLPLLQGVAAGTLDAHVFRHYLEQDYLYLRSYARWYARLAAHAPDEHVEHLVLLAANVVSVELDAHRRLAAGFGADLQNAEPSAETTAYVEFLHAATDGFGRGLAAMLPCLWGYGVALALVPKESSGVYRPWLDTYTSGAYAHVIDRHRTMLDASGLDLDEATVLFDRALEHEVAFFTQLPHAVPAA